MPNEITVLLENTKQESSDFEVEHGLSLFVKTAQSTFIFDCGQTGLAWKNAALMNVDLSEIQFVVLSHSHYDHAAGFPSLFEYVKPSILYTGSNFWREKFSYSPDDQEYKYRGCGFTSMDLSNWNVKQIICDDLLQLDDESWLIGNIVRKYDFETIPKKFVCGEDKKLDDFSDEIVLALREDDRIAVVTGCAHNGIVNIVTTVKQRLNLPIHSVIGGIHLKSADEDRIVNTIETLKTLGVRCFALGHCSGEKIYNYIDDKCVNFRIPTGTKIDYWRCSRQYY